VKQQTYGPGAAIIDYARALLYFRCSIGQARYYTESFGRNTVTVKQSALG